MMEAQIIAKLDLIMTKLQRLELIESHLLDILIPNRKSFASKAIAEPQKVVVQQFPVIEKPKEPEPSKADRIMAILEKELAGEKKIKSPRRKPVC